MVINVATLPKVRLAAEAAYARAMEGLAADLAIYLAAGVHQPAENGQQAVARMLERTAQLPLDMYVEEFSLSRAEADAAMERALECISASVKLIRGAALPPSAPTVPTS